MIIFPAIDLKNGQCVRLFKGDMDMVTVFNHEPAAQALEFQNQGFKYLHLVDLDGAVTGASANIEAIKSIIAAIKIPLQLGGGIRSIADIEKWLELGVSRVILGTIAAKNPEIVKEACAKFSGKIVVGIDAKEGRVATEGWIKTSEITTIELAKKFEDCGVCAIIYTDISRDGTLTGFDYEGTKSLAQNLKIPVIASGGISSIKDVKKVVELEKFGVEGAIIGRALYEKKIALTDLREFLLNNSP